MTFPTFCLCHAFDARARLNAFEQGVWRRQCVQDAKQIVSASFAQAMREAHLYHPGLMRDIVECRVEA